MNKSSIALLLPLAGAGCFTATDDDVETGTVAAELQVLPAGATCEELGLGAEEFRIESPVSGLYSIDAGNSLMLQFYDSTNTIFFYTNSSIRMHGVLVHAGGKTLAWEVDNANGWPSLHGVYDPATGLPYPPEAVSFCFDYNLFVNPNAYANHDKQWTWSIAKTGSTAWLQLALGQVGAVDYAVTVTPHAPTAAGQSADGPVFVRNPTPYTTRIDAVTVRLGDIAATVTCPHPLPYQLAPFETLTCDFAASLPDTTDRVVFADVVSDGQIAVTRSLETLSFADHTTSNNDLDECVKVVDDRAPYAGGLLGSACASGGTQTFRYSLPFGPYDVCGPFSLANTARFTGLDTGMTGASTFTVTGEVPCVIAPEPVGCTLTPGYWKTHSEAGPARYDDTWASLGGSVTPFFASGATYLQALRTSPRGNAYWILAHAYIAAELNQIAGASFTDASAAFEAARRIFETRTPAQVAALSSGSPARAEMIALAATLDAYNNGVTGPGHCE